MTDLVWVISSCVMILAVTVLRAVFGKRLKSGVRMILWALVLLRLLVPGTVFESPVGVESVAVSVPAVSNIVELRDVSSVSYTENSGTVTYNPVTVSDRAEAPARVENNVTPERYAVIKKTLDVKKILTVVWVSGIAVVAGAFLITNISFYVKIRRRRKRIESDCPIAVYTVEGIASPFLLGRSIYVDPETAKDANTMRHVIAHEMSHYRHGDGITTILRCAAVALHWYNPLVWVAAVLSRRDADLFADDGAIKTLGEGEREDYGKTLVDLTVAANRAPILNGATMMAGGKRALFERIKRIAKRPKVSIAAILAVVILASAALVFVFTGKASDKAQENETENSESNKDQTVVDDNKQEFSFAVIKNDVQILECSLDSLKYEYRYNENGSLIEKNETVAFSPEQKNTIYQLAKRLKADTSDWRGGYENIDFKVFSKTKYDYHTTVSISIDGSHTYTVYEFTECQTVTELIEFMRSVIPEEYAKIVPITFDNNSVEDHDIMGMNVKSYTQAVMTGAYYIRYYISHDDRGEPFLFGTSSGFFNSLRNNSNYKYAYAYDRDYIVDVDGDGITELVCNCSAGGDGYSFVEIYKYVDGVVRHFEVRALNLDLDGWYNYGIGSTGGVYDPETNAIYVIYYRVSGDDYNNGEFVERAVDFSEWADLTDGAEIKRPDDTTVDTIDTEKETDSIDTEKETASPDTEKVSDSIETETEKERTEDTAPVTVVDVEPDYSYIQLTLPDYFVINRIELDYRTYLMRARINKECSVLRYYGTYGSSIAVMLDDSSDYTEVSINETVASHTFHYEDGNGILIWNKLDYGNFNFYDVQEAYDAGILTADQVGELAYIQNYGKYLCPDTSGLYYYTGPYEIDHNLANASLVALDDGTKAKIEALINYEFLSWIDLSDKNHPKIDGLRCYYYDGETAVVFEPTMLSMPYSQVFAGSSFSFGSSFELWVYRDGDLIRAKDAYNMDIISADLIANVADLHRIVQQYLYDLNH